MAEYKQNHTIPKALLKYWIDPSLQHQSVHVYDIREQRSYQSTGRKPKPFSFAIVNDLHVPLICGARTVSLEKWFSNLEGALMTFVRLAHARERPIATSLNERVRTLMGLLGLGCRSRYDLIKIQEELAANGDLLSKLNSGDGTPAKQSGLENLINAITEQAGCIQPTEFRILHAPADKSWIMVDRPCVYAGAKDSRIVVLTNKVVLWYVKSQGMEDTCEHAIADAGHVDKLNYDFAMNSREWIVADSKTTLQRYAAITQTDKWRHQLIEDQLTYLPFEHLTCGFRITQ